ncbi:MAG TPA: universal stress protein [Chloroflexia bacterium]|nr:universal stress protein [Chloroflexia bacterium]
MITKIAVPLDGSPLAEKALPYAIRLAHLLKASLALVRVAGDSSPKSAYGEEATEARLYLEQLRGELIRPGAEVPLPTTRVEARVLFGKPATEIAELGNAGKADLIVMTTHGRSGIPRLLLGSVAEGVIHHATVPVVLYRPSEMQSEAVTGAEPVSLGRRRSPVLLPLDGTQEAETGLSAAIELARQSGANLHLLRVIFEPPAVMTTDMATGYLYGGYNEVVDLNELHQAAETYLAELVERINTGEEDLKCVAVVRAGNPSDVIVAYAREIGAGLVVMPTHARAGLGRVLLGSVAENVVRQSNLPVMMIRIHETAQSAAENATAINDIND